MNSRLGSLLLGCAVSVLLGACGGNTAGNTDSESGGRGEGGLPAAGSSAVGNGGTSGGAASGGATSGCCLALAICDTGDTQLKDGEACPANADCYDRSICCSTIRCLRAASRCNALPTCDAGDTLATGACPPSGRQCYTRSLCGNTITCIDTACDPASEYNRKYVGKTPASCAAIDFACTGPTQYFNNDCGCGCEQDASCPEFVDCGPRVDTKPMSALCGDTAQCPYTLRAL